MQRYNGRVEGVIAGPVEALRKQNDAGAARRGRSVVVAVMISMMLVLVAACRGGEVTDGGRVGGFVASDGLSVVAQGDGEATAEEAKDAEAEEAEAEEAPEWVAASLGGHTESVTCFGFSPDGKWIATGSSDGTARVWDVATGAMVKFLSLDEKEARCIGFSPDGTMLACGGGDSSDTSKGLYVWKCETWELFPQLYTNGAVLTLSWSADSVALAIEIRRWKSAVKEEKYIETYSNHAVSVVAVSGVMVREFASRQDSQSYDRTSRPDYRNDHGIRFSPEYTRKGGMIASNNGYSPKGVELFDAHSFASRGSLSGSFLDSYFQWWISPDESLIVTRQWRSPDDGSLREFVNMDSIVGTAERVTVPIGDYGIHGFLSDNRLLVTHDGRNHTITVEKPDVLVPLGEAWGHAWDSIEYTGDGKLFATHVEGSNTIALVDGITGKVMRQIGGHYGAAISVAARPNANQIASGGSDGSVCLWDTDLASYVRTMAGGGSIVVDGVEVSRPTGHSERVNVVVFSPDGKLLASGSNDRRVVLWNPDTGEPVRELKGHHHNVTSMAFRADGKLLATGSEDCTVRIWEVATGKLVSLIKPLEGVIDSVAFRASDGLLLVSGQSDADSEDYGRLSLYHVSEAGECVRVSTWSGSSRWKAVFVTGDGIDVLAWRIDSGDWIDQVVVKDEGGMPSWGEATEWTLDPFEVFEEQDGNGHDWQMYLAHGVPFARSGYYRRYWGFEKIAVSADHKVFAVAGNETHLLEPMNLWRKKK